jgi:hypothetical protein
MSQITPESAEQPDALGPLTCPATLKHDPCYNGNLHDRTKSANKMPENYLC